MIWKNATYYCTLAWVLNFSGICLVLQYLNGRGLLKLWLQAEHQVMKSPGEKYYIPKLCIELKFYVLEFHQIGHN